MKIQHSIFKIQDFSKLVLTFFMVWLVILMFGCGSGGGSASSVNRGPVQNITGIGDSTMAGIGVKDGQVVQVFSWNAYFYSFQNEGISGSTLESWIASPDTRQLNIAVVSIGFNNAKHASQSVAEILAFYSQFLSTIHANKIFLIGIYPMDHELSDVWYSDGAWITNDRIKQINDGIRALAIARGCFYIDTFALFLDPATGQAKKGKSFDGIHPSVSAYEDVIAELIINGILL